ncbi:hypothetical protein B9T13_07785 [Wohlfahrtiimonas chitiniclastica]|uniref:hypothetical protein n=1 Tax=Wohlfahrtiimonas chitiniclastica TaxID=400946 RepID=UPI000B9991B7|nr:hypothetical protein [Wohlfahrtiimonas chitiniclastica]OYQ69455.1 hypothetical protein B9T13_07785 [Wohlfahrtiimonas chitiniclastica]
MEELIRFIDPDNFQAAMEAVASDSFNDAFLSLSFIEHFKSLESKKQKALNRNNLNLLLPVTLKLLDKGFFKTDIHRFYVKRHWSSNSYLTFNRRLSIDLTTTSSQMTKSSLKKEISKEEHEPIKVGDEHPNQSVSSGFIGGSLEETRIRLKEVSKKREERKKLRQQNLN